MSKAFFQALLPIIAEANAAPIVIPSANDKSCFAEGDMAAQIGSWVRWAKFTPTRLGYAPSDVGKVIGIRDGASGDREIDVEFADGDVLRGAFEHWFESAGLDRG